MNGGGQKFHKILQYRYWSACLLKTFVFTFAQNVSNCIEEFFNMSIFFILYITFQPLWTDFCIKVKCDKDLGP